MEIIKKYSPQWEITGLDEAYLDISFKGNFEKAGNLARKLKEDVFKKEKLTSTIGIGPNKLIAKIAAAKAKPDGLLIIKPDEAEEFLNPLDVQDLPGIGPKTAAKLKEQGVTKIKELKKLPKEKLTETFGKTGEWFYQRARGIDEEPVSPEEIVKSIGREYTFEKDTRDPEIIFGVFEKIIEEVYSEVSENNFSFKTITVVCRFTGFETHTKAKTLKASPKDKNGGQSSVLKTEAKILLLKFLLENPKPIRLIGLRLKLC
jgi:DNA polymerase IV (DinB-like DNA polymerase)